MLETDFEYDYRQPTIFFHEKNENILSFAHCSEIKEDQSNPCFFYGNINNSYIASKCLSVLAQTVNTHFALTPGQIAKLKDPIVSVGAGELHFEAFSSCNSVYARVNILKNGIDGEFIHSGTTNIDFNNQTIKALNNVLQSEKLLIGIGSKEVQIITEKDKILEKKVSFPNRWIKGLGNVQVYLSEMELSFELTKLEALQLFKTLPKTVIKSEYYLTKSGFVFEFSPIDKSNSIRIGGIHRLNLLLKLIPLVQKIMIYQHKLQQCFALILDFKDIQMTFLLSNSIYQGFSGEGKLLENLNDSISTNLIKEIDCLFKTNEVFSPTLLSVENDIDFVNMNQVEANLSAIGLLGYNLFNNQYFYRKLPFKLERLIGFNPRLKNAKAIISNDEITILEHKENFVKAQIKGSNSIYHTVLKKDGVYQCTCNWHTNYKNNRGFCKHILALNMFLK